jgi:hypothetical protein
MIIFYSTTDKQILEIEDQQSTHYGKIVNSLKGTGLDIKNYTLGHFNLLYSEYLFDESYDRVDLVFYYLKNKTKKETHLFLDNQSEPRNGNFNKFINIGIKKYGILPKNVYLITSTEFGGLKYDINVVKKFAKSMNFFKINRDNSLNNDVVVNKTKLLSSFNRRTTQQRVLQTAHIVSQFNEDDRVVSLGVGEDVVHMWTQNYFKMICDKPPKLPIVLDHNYISEDGEEQFAINLNQSNCLFDVVNETISTQTDGVGYPNFYHEGVFFTSEKSLRPFLNHQIPIFNSAVGYSEWFEKVFGVDMFRDIIDYKIWDNLCNLNERSEVIVNSLKKFKKHYPNYNEFYKTNIKRFKKNERLIKNLDEDKIYIYHKSTC